MATVLEKKNGGPHTKKDQEQRRNETYALYFERGYSAVKIAQMLGVNRNTTNEDIKYWSKQIATQFGRENLGETLCRQIERLDIQRKRLIDELDKQEEISKKIQLEKLLFDIDCKVTGFISKTLGSNLHLENLGREEIQKERISEVVRRICLSGNRLCPESLTEKDILKEVISITACDGEYVRNLFEVLKSMGLEMFATGTNRDQFDMLSFAVAKKFLTAKERESVFQLREENEKNEEKRHAEVERKYKEKHGPDKSKWSEQTVEQMYDEMLSHR